MKQLQEYKSFLTREFEKKFPFPCYDVELVLGLLQHSCLPHREYPENFIFTVYYDTEDLDAYYENLNGDNIKSKFRIRWYKDNISGENGYQEVFAEIKMKEGLRVKKWRRRINLPGISLEKLKKDLSLIDSLWGDQIKAITTEFGYRKAKKLYPVILTQYQRSRFLDIISGANISLDRGISVINVNTDLLPIAQPTNLSVAILEVKGGKRIPLIMNMVKGIAFYWESFSKYSVCLRSSLKEGL